MKGATTEPCAIINSPPSISITKIIGASQSFLRLLRNAQSSFRISIFLPVLELLFKGD